MNNFDEEVVTRIAAEAAERAADRAIEKAAISFYANVGKGVVWKVLTWLGMLAVGYAVAKGIK